MSGFTSRHRPSPAPLTSKLCAAVCALLLSAAAGCEPPVTERSKALARVLDEQAQPQARPQPERDAAGVRPRIYLDASLSMSGYVTGAVGRRTAFESFVDKLGDYLPGADIYKFGQGADQEMLSRASFDRSLHSRAFYNLTYNPNDALIRRLNSEERPPLSILVTDGVQSDNFGQGNHPVVEAILEWVGGGRTFGATL